MNRRIFLFSTGATVLGTMISRVVMATDQAQTGDGQNLFEWTTPDFCMHWRIRKTTRTRVGHSSRLQQLDGRGSVAFSASVAMRIR